MSLVVSINEPSGLKHPPTLVALTSDNQIGIPISQTVTTTDMPPLLELKDVCKSYGEGNAKASVLSNINLRIKPGEFIAIVGFSGSGKTTLISTIAGLIQADSGAVLKQNKAINAPGPDRGVVFQNYSLMPWLTVYENVALAVDQIFKDWPAAQRKAHTEKYVKMVNLGAPRVASGIDAAQDKVLAFAGQLIPYQQKIQSDLAAMPNATLEDGVNRAVFTIRQMAKFKNR